ncbi:MAG: hypothetical protein HS129_04815 [Leptospiraceae bacterium]|nr:hypothetical protein [Leptospiraceae bacterium]
MTFEEKEIEIVLKYGFTVNKDSPWYQKNEIQLFIGAKIIIIHHGCKIFQADGNF